MSCPICDERSFWPVPFADDPDIARWRADLGSLSDYEWRLCRRCGNAYPSQPPDLRVLERLWAQKRADQGLSPSAMPKKPGSIAARSAAPAPRAPTVSLPR